MELEALLRLKRNIRAVGFDDAPFIRNSSQPVGLAGIVCAGTRFEGMLWGQIEADGWDGTDRAIALLRSSKFLPQLHIILFDGICVGGFNVIDLHRLAQEFELPCVAVMRRMPNFNKIKQALTRLPHPQERLALMSKAGTVHQYPPFYFQVSGAPPDVTAQALASLTDRGKVPEALRLAHLIGAAVVTGESGKRA